MNTPSLSIVIGTIGRPSLEWTLDSIAAQGLQGGDEVIVVRDSFEARDDKLHVRERVERYGDRFHYFEHDAGEHYFGIAQTNHGFGKVRGDFVCSLGDDDIYSAGAFETLRPVLAEDRDRAVLFQFLAPWRQVLWDRPRMRRSRISGQCIAAPRAALVPMGTAHYVEVDFDWMQEILTRTGRAPAWLRELLVITRPELRNGQPITGALACGGCRRVIFHEDAIEGRCCFCAPAAVVASSAAGMGAGA